MRTPLRLTLAAVAALALLAPTATAQEKTGTITGKITFQGKPLTGGVVTFIGKGAKIPGRINADGTYRVREMPVGEAKIVVESKDVAIPKAFASAKTTPLIVRVQEGKQQHDIELK
jgi:hypothetical protein